MCAEPDCWSTQTCMDLCNVLTRSRTWVVVVTNFGTRQRRWLSRWNEWFLLVYEMEKYKRPTLQQEPNVYLEPKWLQCPQCCSGLELIGPAHEELETPEASGRHWGLKLSCSAKKKQPPPDPSPEAGLAGGLEAGLAGGLAGGLEAGVEAGLEACFEQVAQGLWLVRRVHRRSKTISLPGRLELPTLRLTASRSNQLSYGSLCRRPKLVPVLEKRLNNSWLQMVCQTKGQQAK